MADLAELEAMRAKIDALIANLTGADSAPSTLDSGDNAWVMAATALVYLMTPGVAFFYGGMVHKKNLLGTFSLSFLCMGIVTVQWVLFGYSLAFGPPWGVTQLGGGTSSWYALNFLQTTNSFYAPTFPLYTHAAFQCAFAVITPALISGIAVNRMKVGSFCLFVLLWTTLVYDVIAYWVWNPAGWLHEYGALDFAGGTVIHISSGFSALVCSLFLQFGQPEEIAPHEANLPMTVVGGALLWFGWSGFNAGSAASAGETAALALVNTNTAAAAALLTYVGMEHLFEGKTSVIGGICGAVVGLVVITPAAGFVRPGWAILMGIWGTAMVYIGIFIKKKYSKLDDPLDVFSCHGLGGVYGSLLTGLFCEQAVNPGGFDGAFYGRGIQLWIQIAAVLVVVAYASAVTLAICVVLHFTVGLKVSKLEAILGMDQSHALSRFAKDKDTRASTRPAAMSSEGDMAGVIVKARRAFEGDRTSGSLTPEQENQLREIFNVFDEDNTGHLNLQQFLRSVGELRVKQSKEELTALFHKLDANKSGTIDYNEFRDFFVKTSRRNLQEKGGLPSESEPEEHALMQEEPGTSTAHQQQARSHDTAGSVVELHKH